ncbi:MAG: hypothetical protein R3A52_08015 [Polyangiales bacterium]
MEHLPGEHLLGDRVGERGTALPSAEASGTPKTREASFWLVSRTSS